MAVREDVIRGPVIQRASSFVLICLALFAGVVGTTVLVLKLFPADQTGTHRLVAQFEGVDHAETPAFTVDDAWEFRWEHEGHLQQLIWTRRDGTQDMLMEMPGKPIRKHGGVNIPNGGEYRLKVVGTGPWKLEVNQFCNNAALRGDSLPVSVS